MSGSRGRRPRALGARAASAAIAAVVLIGAAGCTGGYQGAVYERLADGSIGALLPGVAIEFVKEDHSEVRAATSDAAGRYRLALPTGRYYVTASHAGFEDDSSAPGFFVVPNGSAYQTGNFFLRQPRVTVALVVRHADRDGANDALTAAGMARAAELAEVASRAGVTAVYSTDFVRTRSTAEPLATRLDLPVEIYTTPAQLAATIAAGHAGDVVLVVGHSNTTTELAEAITGEDLYPGSPNPVTEDFDNLILVAEPVAGGDGSAINLQYGADTAPDTPGLSRSGPTTVLLLRHAESAGAALTPAGAARATELVHVAGKSGAAALFAPAATASAETLAPLAAALGVAVTAYDAADLPALVTAIFADHAGETVAVAGDRATLQALVRELDAGPVPPIYDDEFDHLMAIVAPAAGDGRLVSLQYGADSP